MPSDKLTLGSGDLALGRHEWNVAPNVRAVDMPVLDTLVVIEYG